MRRRRKFVLVHRYALAGRRVLPPVPRGLDPRYVYYRRWRKKDGRLAKFRRGLLLRGELLRGPSLVEFQRRKQDRRVVAAARRLFNATSRVIDALRRDRTFHEEALEHYDHLLEALLKWVKVPGARRGLRKTRLANVLDLLGLLKRAIRLAKQRPEEGVWREGDEVVKGLLEGPVPDGVVGRGESGFPARVQFEAWRQEKLYSATLKDKMHFNFKLMYLGDAGGAPARFLWETALNEEQLRDYRGVFFYFWVVIELDWRAAPFIAKGRLRYDVDAREANTALKSGRRVPGTKNRRAILGVPCTLKAGPDFSGNLTVAEFRRWISQRSTPGRRSGARVDTPNTRAGEHYWQSQARAWARANYGYLKDVDVKVLAFLCFTGDLSPTRGTGYVDENPPKRRKRRSR